MQWVQTHLDRHITVEDLTRLAHLSRRTLIRRFHDALGVTPQQWLLRQRLLLAQDLLETYLPPRRPRRRTLGHGISSQPPPPLQRARRRLTSGLPAHLRPTPTQPTKSPDPKDGGGSGRLGRLLP